MQEEDLAGEDIKERHGYSSTDENEAPNAEAGFDPQPNKRRRQSSSEYVKFIHFSGIGRRFTNTLIYLVYPQVFFPNFSESSVA